MRTRNGPENATATAATCSSGFRPATMPARQQPTASIAAPTKNARIIGASNASPGPCMCAMSGSMASRSVPGAVM